MQVPALPGLEPAPDRRRGRPRGSKNKRSGDLRAWIEATYGGLTPGQQGAAVGLVTAREVREATKEARMLGISPVMLAMGRKAQVLAGLLGCKAAEAWVLMLKERAELMPYIHQRQAPAEGAGKAAPTQPLLIVADVEPGRIQVPEGALDEDEEIQRLGAPLPG